MSLQENIWLHEPSERIASVERRMQKRNWFDGWWIRFRWIARVHRKRAIRHELNRKREERAIRALGPNAAEFYKELDPRL